MDPVATGSLHKSRVSAEKAVAGESIDGDSLTLFVSVELRADPVSLP